MRKVLIPIDGTERSEKSVELVRRLYQPDEVTVHLFMVREDFFTHPSVPKTSMDANTGEYSAKMKAIAKKISEFRPDISVVFGKAGEEIIKMAKLENTDIIIMTKSTKKGWFQTIGSVTAYVVKYAPCMVLIVPETEES